MITRLDGRADNQLREFYFKRDFTKMADGSTLVSFGNTQVLCTASISDEVPRWLRDTGKGWVTAEYSMLPGSTPDRVGRNVSGRDKEIQRLIGRSLRSVVDLEKLGEVAVTIDCDVLQADGGTRTASISGGFVALHDALTRAVQSGKVSTHPITDYCAAISVGVHNGSVVLDLPYVEDASAEVDMNVVMTGAGSFVEVQGTAEGATFDRSVMDQLLDTAALGISQITDKQRELLSEPPGELLADGRTK